MPARRLIQLILFALLLAGCASLSPREPVRVNVAGIEPLPSEGLEARFEVRLRIQNPNDRPVSFDGVFLELELEDRDLGSGVSDQKGTIPRFGEALVKVPVTVPFTAVVRQVFGFAGRRDVGGKVSYHLRGRLGGIGFGGVRFDKRGEIGLPSAKSKI